MKHKRQNKYAYFQAKLFLFALGMVLVACLGTGALYGIWQGRGGDWVVSLLHNVFRLSRSRAHYIYQMVFRNNASAMFFYCTAGIFLVSFLVFLRWMTRLLKKLEEGIDALVSEKGGEITLPGEFSAMEGKLKSLRQTLERRTLEAQLAERRKNDLVMYLAHDIRTPLTSVIGYLSLLDEVPDMPMELRARYTHITLEKANRLEALVNEFFEITRYNLQQIPLQKETVDLYYLLMQLAEEFYPIVSAKGNTVALQASEDLSVYADPGKLARVFNNILKNAVAYADPGTEILVCAARQGGNVRIVIENRGPTIPKEKLTAIFDRFYRLDDARNTESGGAGLGLAIAKEIVTLHGGTIYAESSHGTTAFIVTLPITDGKNHLHRK